MCSRAAYGYQNTYPIQAEAEYPKAILAEPDRSRSVSAGESPLGADAPLVERKIYEMRAAGLQITRIVEFNPQQQR